MKSQARAHVSGPGQLRAVSHKFVHLLIDTHSTLRFVLQAQQNLPARAVPHALQFPTTSLADAAAFINLQAAAIDPLPLQRLHQKLLLRHRLTLHCGSLHCERDCG